MSDLLLDIADYERKAADLLPPAYHAYVSGGVGDNLTMQGNLAAFDSIRLLPRVFRDVSHISTRAVLMEDAYSFPLLTAPAAMNKLIHPDGELAIARACKAMGVGQVLSTMSTTAVEEVTAVGHPVWFQLYLFRDRGLSERLIQRADAAGCKALVLTVDVPMIGLRANLTRAGFSTPATLPFPNLVREGEAMTEDLIRAVATNFDPGLTWADIAWMRQRTRLPIWVKGILRPDDARRAVDAGIDGIIVSNHGGRQLDSVVATIDALPAVADAVGSEVPLVIDGGIRRGTDILKALALGASAVLVGRPPLWGLAVDGEEGVKGILEIYRKEFNNVMAQCGCDKLDAIEKDLLCYQ